MPKRYLGKRGKGRKGGLRMDYDQQMANVEAPSVENFEHPADQMEPAADLELIMEMASKLARINQWLAAGREGGTMDMRTWAMLYVMRPDLLGGETVRDFASARGVQPSRVHSFIAEFREVVGVRFAPASRVARGRTPTPGKASL